MKNIKLVTENTYLMGYNENNVACCYYPLTKEAKELDLPLLPVTPKDKWGVHETHCCEKHGCKYGDNDCCVALGIAKQRYPCEHCSDEEQEFSLEDIQKAFEAGVAWHVNPNISEIDAYTNFIQSLSTQQFPSEFIPEYEINKYSAYGHSTHILKTITNSKGKEEIQGRYVY